MIFGIICNLKFSVKLFERLNVLGNKQFELIPSTKLGGSYNCRCLFNIVEGKLINDLALLSEFCFFGGGRHITNRHKRQVQGCQFLIINTMTISGQ